MNQLTVSAADVDLFHVAARVYGDATLWHLIALANGIGNPAISGVMALTIPPGDPSQTGGAPQQGGFFPPFPN